MKQKFRITFKCKCSNVFKKITANPDLMEASCPSCKNKERKTKFVRIGDGPVTDMDLLAEKVAKNLAKTPEFRQAYMSKVLAPTSQTAKNQIKAIDTTADIVMQDYKLGDLKDRVHQGEAMAPKLAPNLQKQADSFFAGKKNKNLPYNAGAIAKAAMNGAYAPSRTGAINPIAAQHQARARPNVNTVASWDGKK